MKRSLQLVLITILAAVASLPPGAAPAATWATLHWTNPPQDADSIRCVRVRAAGDTIGANLYSSTNPLAIKLPGTPGAPDSAFLSVSTANVVGPAVIRLHVQLHNSAGWSVPSNPASVFYAARDTFYLGPWGSNMPTACWWHGPGLFGFAQQFGDTSWVDWRHQEVVQAEVRARLCAIYGYACRRGVRDVAWCSQP